MIPRISRLAIIGPYPPPSGGASTHVQRLCALLAERGVDFRLYNVSSEAGDGERVVSVRGRRTRFLLEHALRGPEPALYVVSPRLSAWAFGALLAVARRKRVAVRLQNNRVVEWRAAGGWRARAAGQALRRVDRVVCVSDEIADAVLALGVAPERIARIPGFLPPAAAEADDGALDGETRAFLEARRPIVAANGTVAWHDGKDLYGLDLLVELAARLARRHRRVGVVVCLYGLDEEAARRIESLRDRAAALGVADAVHFRSGPGSFVPVLARADVFVRPTNTDGDANSVREAIYLGVPAVASDAAARPAAALRFRSRDLDDLETRVAEALARPRGATADGAEERARADRYVALLTELLEGTRAP